MTGVDNKSIKMKFSLCRINSSIDDLIDYVLVFLSVDSARCTHPEMSFQSNTKTKLFTMAFFNFELEGSKKLRSTKSKIGTSGHFFGSRLTLSLMNRN